MRLVASIVTYNTPHDELTTCITNLMRDGVEALYIIDNSPRDHISDLLRTLPGNEIIEYIPRPDNPGYGAAHNIALRKSMEAHSQYHLVINSDVTFDPGTLKRLTEFMDLHPDAGMMQPRVVYQNGLDQYSSRLLPTPLDVIGRRFLPSFLMAKRNRKYLLMDRPKDAILNIPFFQGSFQLIRTAVLKDVGTFDERFFMYPEDIDITRRIHRKYQTLYWPEVTVTHAHHASSYTSLRMLRIHIYNMIKYFNKWGWFHDPERRAMNRRLLRTLKSSRDA